MKTCCICGSEYEGWGCNPQPFDGEECCQECDDRWVIPARMLLGRGYDDKNILTLLQTFAELGTSIRGVNAKVKQGMLQIVRSKDETSGKSNADNPA